jgi:hypothetical protein
MLNRMSKVSLEMGMLDAVEIIYENIEIWVHNMIYY